MPEVGAALRHKFSWVAANEPIYLVMDNAGGHGTDKAVEEYTTLLRSQSYCGPRLPYPSKRLLRNVSKVLGSEAGDQRTQRHLMTCPYEDLFIINTDIEMRAYGVTLDCNQSELDELGDTLAAAHQNVIEADPRLDDVMELVVNMCEEPTTLQRRKLMSRNNGNGYGFNFGSGRCRWCSREDRDCDSACENGRRLSRRLQGLRGKTDEPSQPDTTYQETRLLEERKATESDSHRKLQAGEVTGFRLYGTSEEENPQYLKMIEHGDIIDMQLHDNNLNIEAVCSGDVEKVVFNLDGQQNYRTEDHPPFLLNSKNDDGNVQYYTTPALSNVGKHTITAIPHDSNGNQLTPAMFSFLIVDGSTNAVIQAAPGSREELIRMLEDDLIIYMSGEVNKQFFYEPGHCLEGNLMFMDVVLTETSESAFRV